MDRRLFKPLLVVTIVLIVPVVVLILRGEAFATQLQRWQSAPPPSATLAALVVAILAVDVVLPVPSGPVSTLAGSQLGIPMGAAASCLGMTLGATIAFALARGVITFKRSRSHQRESGLCEEYAVDPGRNGGGNIEPTEAQLACRKHGSSLLIITRPLPIIAEAAVLLVGGLHMPWRQFLPPVVVSNLAISITYAALGRYAADHGWLPLAVCTSIALPLAIAMACRRRIAADKT